VHLFHLSGANYDADAIAQVNTGGRVGVNNSWGSFPFWELSLRMRLEESVNGHTQHNWTPHNYTHTPFSFLVASLATLFLEVAETMRSLSSLA